MKLSIIVPYLSKSKSFSLFKQILFENTENEFELIEIINNTDVFGAYNEGVLKASGDIIVCISDDMYVSPGWDVNIVKHIKPYTVITMGVIERGKNEHHNMSIEGDFGDSPQTFRREEFEQFCKDFSKNFPEVRKGCGWLQPFAILKLNWVPYPNKYKYGDDRGWNDIFLFEKVFPAYDMEMLVATSFVYHLQRYSYNIKYQNASP